MPENPNAKMPERTEPAVQPEGAAAPQPTSEMTDEEIKREGEQTTEAQLSEILSNPATIKAVAEFLIAEDLDLAMVEVTPGMWGWAEGGDIAHVEMQGEKYGPDYFVSPDSDTTTRMATALVKNDLSDDPSMFNESFINSYINVKRLRDMLHDDVEEMARETLRDEKPELSDEERERTPNAVDIDEAEIAFNKKVDQQVEEELRDPIQYLKDIYSDADGIKQAIQIAGINIEEAAEDAVAADGEGHFLPSYDGKVNDLPSGGQWWRHN